MAQEEQGKVGGLHEGLSKAKDFRLKQHPIFLVMVIGLSWYFGGPMATIFILLMALIFEWR